MNNIEFANRVLSQVQQNSRRADELGLRAEITVESWMGKLVKSKGYCTYCNEFVGIDNLTLEHKIPLSRGGHSVNSNIVPSCQRRNVSKKDKTVNEWNDLSRYGDGDKYVRCRAEGAISDIYKLFGDDVLFVYSVDRNWAGTVGKYINRNNLIVYKQRDSKYMYLITNRDGPDYKKLGRYAKKHEPYIIQSDGALVEFIFTVSAHTGGGSVRSVQYLSIRNMLDGMD